MPRQPSASARRNPPCPAPAGAAIAPPPPPRPPRSLATVGAIRREAARIYREARDGTLPVEHASKLANILQIIARLVEGGDLERRIEALEEAKGVRP